MGEEELDGTAGKLEWNYAPFEVPEDAFGHWRGLIEKGADIEKKYLESTNEYKQKYPKEFEEFWKLANRDLPADWESKLPTYPDDDKPMATRQYSQIMLNAMVEVLPGLIGGSADLTHSNLT